MKKYLVTKIRSDIGEGMNDSFIAALRNLYYEALKAFGDISFEVEEVDEVKATERMFQRIQQEFALNDPEEATPLFESSDPGKDYPKGPRYD